MSDILRGVLYGALTEYVRTHLDADVKEVLDLREDTVRRGMCSTCEYTTIQVSFVYTTHSDPEPSVIEVETSFAELIRGLTL